MKEKSDQDALKLIGSKYSLVHILAKRAKEIMDGDKPLIKSEHKKPINIAMEELLKGAISWTRPAVLEDKKPEKKEIISPIE